MTKISFRLSVSYDYAHSNKNFIKKQNCFEGTVLSENYAGKTFKIKNIKNKIIEVKFFPI